MTDLDMESTIGALFDDATETHTRIDTFDHDYAGRTIEWTADVERARASRHNGDAALRTELFLGYASEGRLPTDRVVAEAYFAADATIEPGTTITFAGTLTGLNVYARRIVIDEARII